MFVFVFPSRCLQPAPLHPARGWLPWVPGLGLIDCSGQRPVYYSPISGGGRACGRNCQFEFPSLCSPGLNRWVFSLPPQLHLPGVGASQAAVSAEGGAGDPGKVEGAGRSANQGDFKGHQFSQDLENKDLGTLMRSGPLAFTPSAVHQSTAFSFSWGRV